MALANHMGQGGRMGGPMSISRSAGLALAFMLTCSASDALMNVRQGFGRASRCHRGQLDDGIIA
jgi:hypothetical protein